MLDQTTLPPVSAPVEVAEQQRVVETERTHISERGEMLIKELLRPGVQLEAVIPADAEPQELWQVLDACVKGCNLLESRITRLKPIIGHILLMFQNKPALFQELGYQTYSDFLHRGCYDTLGLHRSSAYQGVLAARDWPQLTPDRYVKIGPKKLDILSKFAKGKDPNAEQLLKVAESMKVPELQNYCESRGFVETGETTGATITITTNRAVASLWKEFSSDGRIHSIVGTRDHGDILKALIQESYTEWVTRAEERES